MSSDPTDAPVEVPALADETAIRISHVSKHYALWASPGARLAYPALSVVQGLLPAGSSLKKRFDEKRRTLFREFRALQDISFEVKKGESWGIVGVNGSGKSTLLKIVSGNLRPTHGFVELDGRVAILDVSSGLHGNFSGRENVYMKAAIFGMSRQEIERKFPSIAAFAEIGDFMDQPVKTYSSGMVARLGFAILAHVEADIIITDEALAVGDAFFVQKCMTFIRAFLNRGTFLFVSHSTNDVVSLCQKAVWLDGGCIRAIGTAREVTDAYLSSRTLHQSRRYLEKIGEAEEAEPIKSTVPKDGLVIEQPELSELVNSRAPRVVKDPRLAFLNHTQWRNDIQIPDLFAPDGTQGFGVGGARIESVTFQDDTGADLSWIIGADIIRLTMTVRALKDLRSPIVGFQVRDRLGQVLFADNTYLVTVHKPFVVAAGQPFEAEFRFQVPLLPVGQYAIRAAVAEGAEDDHAMLHCVDTALLFESTTSGARHGLVGVPMLSVAIKVID